MIATIKANYVAAFAVLVVSKAALFVYSASGAEGQTSRLLMFWKFFLCLGWDVVGALLVTVLAGLVALPWARGQGRGAVRASMIVQALHGLYLAINLEVAKAVGAPLEKAAIDLAFFNADPHAGAGWDMASSIGAFFTGGVALELLLATALPPLVLLWAPRFVDRAARRARWFMAGLAALFVASAMVVPGVANGPAAVHTYGLERSPLTLLLGSYLKAPLRALASPDPPPADPFCLDMRAPLGAPVEAANPLRGASPRRTNLLIVFLESVGSTVLRHDPAPMPFLSGLGGRPGAVEFSGHVSTWPQTMKAIFSLLCSEMPDPDYAPITYRNPAIPCISLPEALKAAGYATALFTSGDLAFDRQLRFYKHRRFDQLTDRYDMPGKDGAWSNTWGIDEKVTVRAVLAWMRARAAASSGGAAAQPFFAIYNVASGHHPYEFPGSPSAPGLDVEAEADAQRATLRYVDDRLAGLFEGLRTSGLTANTLVAIVSDHGPGSGRPGMGRVRDGSVYEGSIHVPFALAGPQLAGVAGPVVFATSHLDFAPTLLGLLGLQPPMTMKGRDLTRTSEARAIIMATRPPLSQIGVRSGKWKLVLWQETGIAELFDVVADPREQNDVRADHMDEVARLLEVAHRWRVHSRNLVENYASILRTSGRRCDFLEAAP